MATTSYSPAPVSRFPRLGLGLRLKSSNMTSNRGRRDAKQPQDEWYIPYSGPYEPPQEPVRQRNDRDSWGDPVYGGDNEDDTALASLELRRLYDNGNDNVPGDDSRDRMQSAVSGRTVSSGNVDPRISGVTQRRSTVSSAHRPNVTSYISIDASGGIGESPAPASHQRTSSKENNKGTTIGGLFAFGGQGRNKSLSEKNSRKLLSKKPRPGLGIGPITPTHRRSSSTGSNSLLDRGLSQVDRISTTGIEATNEDLYNSYYFSSRASQNSPPNHPYRAAGPAPPADTPKLYSSPPQSTRHPYAYVFPTSHYDDRPQTAPLPSSDTRANANVPGLTFTDPPAPQKPATANLPQFSIPSTFPFQKGLKRLKNSASTPDLRIGAGSASPQSRTKGLSSSKPSSSSTFKPKDRWLSAETWCDALLFPRPRLKVRQEGGGEGTESRIVSPPGSPIYERPGQHTVNGVQGIPSRVLAHSRSLADLNQTRGSPVPDRQLPAAPPPPPPPPKPIQQNAATLAVISDRPSRPKSWALDDLDLPTPVPSLARVIEEGEKLETQRKQWKEQATHSFQNQRTRSVSRVRSKSLTHKGKKREELRPTNINLLAARAYLGNQLMTPVIATMRKPPEAQMVTFSSSGTFSKPSSHGHSNSLAKTISKSSKSHSRGHSRTDSWGRSALKIAKTATCGLSASGHVSPAISFENGLESALRRDDTKIIRLADPAVDEPAVMTSSSPTPPASVISDMRIGIALTTPPLVDNSAESESIRPLAHPYAQGGMYSYTKAVSTSRSGNEITASLPEPAVQKAQPPAKSRPTDLPTISYSQQAKDPQPAIYHPYAQPSTLEPYAHDDTLTPYSRMDSDVPAAAKMWARFSPGVVREILPGEILYSPFMSEDGDASEAANDTPPAIYDTVGVGEALAYAVQHKSSKDSGLGTSEDHTAADTVQPQPAAVAAKRSYRQSVQYDTTRPPHLQLSKQEKKPSDPNSARTFASSPLLRQQSPPPELPHYNSSRSDNLSPSRTTSTSPESLSPSQSPRSFGHPDDLESFHDLFYKRSANSTQHKIQSELASTSVSDGPQGARLRTGSGLTSLARQLTEELEAMTTENEGSQYSRSSATGLTSSTGRRPNESTLEFVFEETSPPESLATSQSPLAIAAMSPFQASSARIPEDISSSRASSPLEANDSDEDRTEELHLGLVESVATPPPVENDHRSSLSGHLVSPSTETRIPSSLQPPSADPTRSSYMTTSTVSRISGLSDFPAPPQRHLPGHISLLTSYFDEAHTISEANASRNHTPPAIPASSEDTNKRNRHLTFGGEEEIDELEELVAALSSHSHSPHL